jgi:hypothetical protein
VGLTVDLGHDIEPDRGGEDGGERERAGGLWHGDEDKRGTEERDLPPEADCTVTVGLAAIAVVVEWMMAGLNQGSSHHTIRFGNLR